MYLPVVERGKKKQATFSLFNVVKYKMLFYIYLFTEVSFWLLVKKIVVQTNKLVVDVLLKKVLDIIHVNIFFSFSCNNKKRSHFHLRLIVNRAFGSTFEKLLYRFHNRKKSQVEQHVMLFRCTWRICHIQRHVTNDIDSHSHFCEKI